MDFINGILSYVREDWQTNRWRFCLEVLAFLCSLVSAIIFALTATGPIPIVLLYTIFITGCVSAAICAYSRGSTGLLVNYITLVTIDGIGLIRVLLS